MGEVYLVQHPRLPRREALKVLRPGISSDTSFRERFIREADLAAGLRHPHIVGIHDRGEHEGQLWIAMDYIDGTDAAQLLEQKYPAGMPIDLVESITTSVASALDYAHRKGLLHRDVKPANIIVADLDGDESGVYLADFGIARPVDDIGGITTTNMTVGTVAFAAPEQLMGDAIDGRADQYALAAAAYHLLSGAQLFPHSNPAVVISRHLNAPVPELADTRPDLASLDSTLATALAKNPDDRFAACVDFARALTNASSSKTTRSAVAPTTPALPARRPRATPPSTENVGATDEDDSARSATRRTLGVSVVAALLLLGVIGLSWRLWERPQSSTTATSTSRASSPSSPTATAAPPPVTTSVAPQPPPASTVTVTTKVVASKIGTPCAGSSGYNIGKLSIDPADDRIIVCGYDDSMNNQVWQPVTEPLVGTVESGSSCLPSQSGQSARSTAGYLVSCFDPGMSEGFIWAGGDY
ncbi:serine/threonine protein kinase [Mycolicibacterium sp. CAU 1645]|uniref:non-specific serine/threonine protein kinase n=2 Tax=Mycolicibacterium arenosum TaxID=2952157 RepID=A0ABT1MCP6_9MYCO|nr:serine/threonine protein kinase [Mycolicibacterium sp. CAU 1645]